MVFDILPIFTWHRSCLDMCLLASSASTCVCWWARNMAYFWWIDLECLGSWTRNMASCSVNWLDMPWLPFMFGDLTWRLFIGYSAWNMLSCLANSLDMRWLLSVKNAFMFGELTRPVLVAELVWIESTCVGCWARKQTLSCLVDWKVIDWTCVGCCWKGHPLN